MKNRWRLQKQNPTHLHLKKLKHSHQPVLLFSHLEVVEHTGKQSDVGVKR